MDLSIIIVNYNVRDFLENALASLRRSAHGIEHEILVVDNASDDGSVEMVRSKFPDVLLTANTENLGFAKANNIALRHAKGEYFLLINPDTIVQEDTLKKMLEFFKMNSSVGMAGCKILNPDGTLQLGCRRSFPTPLITFGRISGLASLFPRSKWFGRYNLTYLNPDETLEVDAISGSFMMIRRKVYEEIGGLDENFFMYGEDLDWCYRVQQAGWKVFYVHTTQIIHYKGESTKRSNIDEIKIFYQAMHLFVKKHFHYPLPTLLLLRFGILLRGSLARILKLAKPLPIVIFDAVIIDATLILGEYIWCGKIESVFPSYAYPWFYIIPPLIIILANFASGVYTTRRHSVVRTFGGVIIGYTIISALVFFFKGYAFSRAITLISFAMSVVALPFFRIIMRIVGAGGRKQILGRKTLVIGTGPNATDVLRKLQSHGNTEYNVLGLIDTTRQHLGERIGGIEIVGSIDNIGRLIHEMKITDIIFSADTLSYADILTVIGRSRNRAVNFRLVPSSMDVIIGKTHVDQLDDIPLVEIEYNIARFSNRFVKRCFDVLLSIPLLLSVYPFLYLKRTVGGSIIESKRIFYDSLPKIFFGQMSFIGPTAVHVQKNQGGIFIGKSGLTGLVQLSDPDLLTSVEIDKLNLYYAKNQSFSLDIEILIKALLQRRKEL